MPVARAIHRIKSCHRESSPRTRFTGNDARSWGGIMIRMLGFPGGRIMGETWFAMSLALDNGCCGATIRRMLAAVASAKRGMPHSNRRRLRCRGSCSEKSSVSSMGCGRPLCRHDGGPSCPSCYHCRRLGEAIWGESRFKQGETDMGDKGKKDKGRREQQKKAKLDLKGKRKQKKEKKK